LEVAETLRSSAVARFAWDAGRTSEPEE